jgi:hypothetical protein
MVKLNQTKEKASALGSAHQYECLGLNLDESIESLAPISIIDSD